MFFTHFASKNQLPGFSIVGPLAGNRLKERTTNRAPTFSTMPQIPPQMLYQEVFEIFRT